MSFGCCVNKLSRQLILKRDLTATSTVQPINGGNSATNSHMMRVKLNISYVNQFWMIDAFPINAKTNKR